MNEVSKVDANRTKSPARPSHEALEHEEHESRIDQIADESAERASNRLKNNEERDPGRSIFTK
ncbi:MAG: hypothetical protein JSS87_04385 [Acidobacteria bacterium]|nr:hypothetical protein [Acidobacteriota bacterium]